MKKKIVLMAVALAVLCPALFAGGRGQQGGTIRIGVSLPTLREERWAVNYRGFVDAAERAGVEVLIQVADNNAARQQSQVENLITLGVKALIITPHDGSAARTLVQMAKRENIPVIAFDRPIPNGSADLYVFTDQYQLGRIMGQHIWDNVPSGNLVFLKGDPGDYTVPVMAQGSMDVIKPRVDSGTYRIVMDQHVADWVPENAMRHMENALTANNNNIQGVIAPNDGTAGGVIQALTAVGLAGRVPVTGQDAEVDAIRRIIAGTQSMTVLYDDLRMSEAALQAAVRLARGEPSGATGTGDDGTPLLGFPPTLITRDNYRSVLIDNGLLTEEELR